MEDLLLEHMGKGFILMLVISMPCVLMAAAIGLVVGVLQAVTQVQEQTIAAAPKIFAVFLVLMIGGGTFTSMLVNFFQESSHIAFEVITKEDTYALEGTETLLSSEEKEHGPSGDLNKKMGGPNQDMYRQKDPTQAVISTKGLSSPQPSIAESKYIHQRR
jgi:type III secretory pathway component EscS